MRILQLANFYSESSGGLRTALHQLAAEYELAGHEVARVVPGGRRAKGEQLLGNARHIELPGRRLGDTGYRVVTDTQALTRAIRSIAPDVIELSDKTTMVAAAHAARASGTQVVLLSHERIDAILRDRLPSFIPLAKTADAWNRHLARRCDAVVCASNFAAAEWGRIRAPHVHRIALGVDLDVFAPHPTATPASLARAALQLVCVGRLSPEKNPHLPIDTVRALFDQGVPCELHMIGDGPLSAELWRHAGDLPVHFAGHVGDRQVVADWLRSADVALAPCQAETFGLSALEAMACGTPVVVAAGGALRELVAPGTGAVAAPTAAAFAAAVQSVARCDRQIATIFTRSHAERFPWSATAGRMLTLMEQLTGTAGPRPIPVFSSSFTLHG